MYLWIDGFGVAWGGDGLGGTQAEKSNGGWCGESRPFSVQSPLRNFRVAAKALRKAKQLRRCDETLFYLLPISRSEEARAERRALLLASLLACCSRSLVSGVQSRDAHPVRFLPFPFSESRMVFFTTRNQTLIRLFFVSKEVRHFCAFRSVRLKPENSNDATVHETADVSVTPPNASFFLAGGFLLLTRQRAAAPPARPCVKTAAANTQSQRLLLSRARRSSHRRPHKCHHRRLQPCSPREPAGKRAPGLRTSRAPASVPGHDPVGVPAACVCTRGDLSPCVCLCVQCCARRKSPVFVRGYPPYQRPRFTVGLPLPQPQLRTIKGFVASFIR